MKLTSTLLCAALATSLAACGPSQGYYDSRGNYHQGSAESANNASVDSGYSGDSYNSNNYYTDTSARRGDSKRVTDYDSKRDLDRIVYKRAGYYDYNGRYIPSDRAPYASRSYYPPRGMCRVWFADREPNDQPPVESCSRIQYRVPYGAYVVYGG